MWQAKDLQEGIFGSVAMIELTSEILEVWQGKELLEQWRVVSGPPRRAGE